MNGDRVEDWMDFDRGLGWWAQVLCVGLRLVDGRVRLRGWVDGWGG